MDWEPISRDALLEEVERGVATMSPTQLLLWKAIEIEPQKWVLHPWGDKGGGFWVVALMGQSAIWYNDIEGGFNQSPFTQTGFLDEYWCNQDELQYAIEQVFTDRQMESGLDGWS